MMDNVTFQVKSSPVLPTSIGLKYKEFNIVHNTRKVRAWLVEALPPDKQNNTTVILFNGIGDNLSKWIYFQKFLADSGISSVSFDYGPLDDTMKNKGSSRLQDVTKDVAVIIDTLTVQYGHKLDIFLMGHSVGNAVMLEMYSDINKIAVKGVIVCNAFNSMKKWSVEHGKLPGAFAFAFPNYYDNVKNIRKVTNPVLIMHSKADKTNSFSNSLEVFKAANADKQFVQFENYKHNDIFKDANFGYWNPIINFIKSHSSK